jgi:hypothetical protein
MSALHSRARPPRLSFPRTPRSWPRHRPSRMHSTRSCPTRRSATSSIAFVSLDLCRCRLSASLSSKWCVVLTEFCVSALLVLTFVFLSPYSTLRAQQEAKRLMDLEDEYEFFRLSRYYCLIYLCSFFCRHYNSALHASGYLPTYRSRGAAPFQLPTILFEPHALLFISCHAFQNSFARILIDFGRHRWTPDADLRCVSRPCFLLQISWYFNL